MELMEIKPKVSVCVMTYNQEKYIGQCLQSIVDQVTDFDFEVIVADDCSTDGTAIIVQNFVREYPSVVRAVLHEKNVGVGKNYRAAHDLARGEYVAHCDGDDLWLPGKLAFQADLLDKNPLSSQCWGCANLINDDGKEVGIFPSRLARYFYPRIVTPELIALSYALVGQHSTQMYRRSFKFNFDVDKPLLDFWIAFNMSLGGPAIYSKEILGCYRITATNSMTRSPSKRRATVDFLALHLVQIIQRHPEFAKEAKANLILRRFISKLKGHSLDIIDEQIKIVSKISFSVFDVAKSFIFFALQKL